MDNILRCGKCSVIYPSPVSLYFFNMYISQTNPGMYATRADKYLHFKETFIHPTVIITSHFLFNVLPNILDRSKESPFGTMSQ